MKKLHFLFTLLFLALAPHQSFATEKTIDIEALYNNPISADLRATFDSYAAKYNPSQTLPLLIRRNITNAQLKLFKEKFIVLEIVRGPFGGFFVDIILNRQKIKMWRLWIYDISGDRSEYDIRQITEFKLRGENREQYLPLLGEEYWQYWR